VFNLCGYLLLVDFLKYREQLFVQQIIESKTYQNSDVLELSAPVDLPYLSDWQDWEQVEGMVVIEQVPYQFVERKLQGGRMYYRCLPNKGMHRVLSARENFLSLSYDLTNANTQKSPFSSTVKVKPPVFDMICLNPVFKAGILLPNRLNTFSGYVSKNLARIVIPAPTPPPDIA
jgi:hypothetical protein